MRLKGEHAFVFIHDGNPQNGAPYNEHDRRMRDDEFEDFLLSCKGWHVVKETSAITRTFQFDRHALAYEWMGRVMGFAYMADKFPRVVWMGSRVDVTVYSGRFKGLSVREARLAAFMSDQAFLIRTADQQRKQLVHGSPTDGLQQTNPLE